MSKKLKVGDLVETLSFQRYGIILELEPEGKHEYLPDCHALIAFLDGLTYWKLCTDLKVISKS
jgi:hypothetical protein